MVEGERVREKKCHIQKQTRKKFFFSFAVGPIVCLLHHTFRRTGGAAEWHPKLPGKLHIDSLPASLEECVSQLVEWDHSLNQPKLDQVNLQCA